MWRHLLGRLNIAVHPGLRRQLVPNKQIHGVFCGSSGGGLDAGEVICLAPFVCSVAANIAAASPWGARLMDVLSYYSVTGEGVQVEYSKESAVTTVFCALIMHSGVGPLCSYLQWINVEHESDTDIRRKLGEAAYARLQTVEKLNKSIILALSEDTAKGGWQIPLAVMERAHELCSSRCVDVPRSNAVFGGPALVPFVDLINHADDEPNMVVYVDTPQSVGVAVRQSRKFPLEFWEHMDGSRCPFYVVARAERDIAENEELHYRYVDSHDTFNSDPLFWASRFHFCP
ncbi:hypothetical protein DQ04_03361050 [Trypanosoma grayi]|uniref:hypothetical protein n=1 Tax=Trypanosoma grayi TaxID=71804 RepID=UPI0004F410EE|nr:hypothetical protein DQ04_03361050 [Trypanosoma grayi]KEG10733.1 hypothetical protein DQ04_03361050 [Trypanosoma grayi]